MQKYKKGSMRSSPCLKTGVSALKYFDEHYMYVSGGNIFIGDYEVSVVGWDSQLNGLICERQLS